MDDIWISGYLARREVARYVVPGSVRRLRIVRRQRRTLSLHHVLNGRQHNNNETIAFFRDAWTCSHRLTLFVFAMNMVMPPLDTENSQKNPRADELSRNSAEK